MNTGASFRRYLAQKLHALHFYRIGLPWASTRCDFCQALLGTCCFVHIRQNDVIRSTPIPAHYYPKAFPPLSCLVLQLLLSVALCTPCKYCRRLQRDIILLKLSGTCSFSLFAFVRNVTRSTPTTTHHGRQTSPNIRPSSMSFSTVRSVPQLLLPVIHIVYNSTLDFRTLRFCPQVLRHALALCFLFCLLTRCSA